MPFEENRHQNYFLFKLVKAIAKKDSKHFIRFANNEGKKNPKHVKLFKSFSKMENETRNEVIARTAAGYPNQNTFSQGKNKLLGLLYRFLVYKEGKKANKDYNAHVKYHELSIEKYALEERGEREISYSRLREAIKLSIENDLNEELLCLLNQHRMYLRRNSEDSSLKKMEDLANKIDKLLRLLSIENKVLRYYDRLFIGETKIDIDSQKNVVRTAIEFFEKENFQLEHLTDRSCFAYIYIYAKYYELIDNNPKAVVKEWQRMLKRLEKKDYLASTSKSQERYLNIHNNYFTLLVDFGMLDKKAFQNVLNDLNRIEPVSDKIKFKLENHKYYYQLKYNDLVHNYRETLLISKEVEAIIKNGVLHDIQAERRSVMQYLLATSYFNSAFPIKENTEALDKALYLAKMIDKNEGYERSSVRIKCKLMIAHIAYLKGEEDLFERYFNSISHLLRDQNIRSEFEIGNDILLTLRRANNAIENEAKECFKTFLATNKSIETVKTVEYLEFFYWIEKYCEE